MKKSEHKKSNHKKPDVYGAYDALQILEEIIYRVIKRLEIYSLVGTVSDIDETQRICTVSPLDGSAVVYGVRLQASLSPQNGPLNNGVVNIPKDQSNVIVTFLNKDTGFISQMTEVAKTIQVNEDVGSYSLTVKDKSVKVDASGVVFNGGNNGGLLLLQNTVSRLNDHEKVMAELQTLMTTHIHPTPAGPSSVSSNGASTQVVPTTTNSDLENTDVKQ